MENINTVIDGRLIGKIRTGLSPSVFFIFHPGDHLQDKVKTAG